MSTTEIITPSEARTVDLQSHADEINKTLDLIVMHEDAFEESTLEPRLIIGLEIAKAQEVFGMTIPNPSGTNQHNKEVMAQCATTSNPLGFSKWLAVNIKRLPRSTARKYSTAFKSLGLSSDHATPAAIHAKIKDLRHHCGKNSLPMPTLHGLYKAGKPGPKNPQALVIVPPPDSQQLRLEDAREAFHLWREHFERAVKSGQLDDLDRKGILEMKEFLAGARDRVNARLK